MALKADCPCATRVADLDCCQHGMAWHGMHSRPAPARHLHLRLLQEGFNGGVGPLMQVPEHCVLRPYCTVIVNDYRKSQCILITLHLHSIPAAFLRPTLQYHVGSITAIVLKVALSNNQKSRHFLLHPPTCSHDSAMQSSSSRAERPASHGSQSVLTTWPSERQAEKTFVWESFFRVRRVRGGRLRYNVDQMIRSIEMTP